jgi:hypothetical protein
MPGVSHPAEAAGDGTDQPARAEPIRLSHEDIGAIAAAVAPALAQAVTERVRELLDEREANDLVDAADLARVLGVDREWVYAHADQLGAIRLGDGPRPRLRFQPGRAVELFRELSAERRVVPIRGGPRAPPVPRPRRSREGRR